MLNPVSGSAVGGWSYPSDGNGMRDIVMDVNGDGKADIVRIWNNNGSALADVWIANASGVGFVEVSNSNVGGWNYGSLNDSSIKDYAMDVNGDGKSDLVRVWRNGNYAYAQVWISNGAGFDLASNSSIGGWNYPADGTGMRDFVMDINGDGKDDLIRLWNNAGSAWANVWVSNAAGNGFTEVSNAAVGGWSYPADGTGMRDFVMDVNGDGKSDLVRLWNNNGVTSADILVANVAGTGFTELSNGSVGAWNYGINNDSAIRDYIMDVNGDGKADLVRLWNNNGVAWAQIWISTGLNFSAISNAAVGMWNYPHDGTGMRDFVMDVNGDGKSDLVRLWNNNGVASADVWVSNSSGNGFIEKSNTSIGGWNYPANGNGIKDFVMDVYGDGRPELVRLWQNGSSAYASVLALGSSKPNLVTSICDGFACDYSISYYSLPAFNGVGYSRNIQAVWPTIQVSSPLQVVAKLEMNDGVTGKRTTKYTYGDLLASVGSSGRGSLGFQWIQSKDVSTGLVSRTCYRQDWPYIGMVSKALTATSDTGIPSCNAITSLAPLSASGSNLLSLSLNKYTFTATDSAGTSVTCKDGDPASCASGAIQPGKRYQTYGFESFSQSRDWDGTSFIALPATHTTQTQDSWGNTTNVMVETLNADGVTASGYSKTTTNTFAPADTSNWFLGRLTKSSVKTTAP